MWTFAWHCWFGFLISILVYICIDNLWTISLINFHVRNNNFTQLNWKCSLFIVFSGFSFLIRYIDSSHFISLIGRSMYFCELRIQPAIHIRSFNDELYLAQSFVWCVYLHRAGHAYRTVCLCQIRQFTRHSLRNCAADSDANRLLNRNVCKFCIRSFSPLFIQSTKVEFLGIVYFISILSRYTTKWNNIFITPNAD